tara:strand:- start:380 stop:637 length:258 start_codon:yes stop_codon:yes gene_type:complete
MDKKLVEAFVLECKQEQEWKERFKANHIDFNDYFKYSGKIEEVSDEYKEYLGAQTYAAIKATVRESAGRKEYFRQYWLKYKLNQI